MIMEYLVHMNKKKVEQIGKVYVYKYSNLLVEMYFQAYMIISIKRNCENMRREANDRKNPACFFFLI